MSGICIHDFMSIIGYLLMYVCVYIWYYTGFALCFMQIIEVNNVSINFVCGYIYIHLLVAMLPLLK